MFQLLFRLYNPIILIIFLLTSNQVIAGDRHAGYYYPTPQSVETYVSKTITLKTASRSARISLATEFMNTMLVRPYAPTFALFVKGEYGEKMIITSLQGGRLNTLYRLRALLAILTSRARETELFKTLDVVDRFNFLDMLKFFGFERLTITDGDIFAHQFNIE